MLGDIASLRELWGDAALYVAPDDHQALERALQRLIGDDALRVGMGERAHRRAQDFTSETMTGEYLELYQAVSLLPRDAKKGTRRCA